MYPYFYGSGFGFMGIWFILGILTWIGFLVLLFLAIVYLLKRIRQR
jgi:hypothetical protein